MPSDNEEENIGQKGNERLTKKQVIEKRAEALKNLKKVIVKYEEYIAQNPDDAEEGFDRSVSMKRYRMPSSENLLQRSSQHGSSAIGKMRNSLDPHNDKRLPTSPPSVAPIERKKMSP